jgi:hypothetical protein
MSLELPEKPGLEREHAIRDLVCDGQAEYTWETITSTHGDHTAEFMVFGDALKIQGVRVGMSAETEQIVADMLGCSLLTAKLADLIWLQRQVTLKPFPHGNPVTMHDTAAMLKHSAKIDAALEALGNPGGIISTTGKHWIIDNSIADGRLIERFPVACNYGWPFEGPSFEGIQGEVLATQAKGADGKLLRLIQGRGTRHNNQHADYSQICVLVSLDCIVDGQPMKLADLLVDPELAPLACHAGVLKCVRQPGAAEHGIIVS